MYSPPTRESPECCLQLLENHVFVRYTRITWSTGAKKAWYNPHLMRNPFYRRNCIRFDSHSLCLSRQWVVYHHGPMRNVLPETVQFSICFTLHVIYLTLTLPAKWLIELSVRPGDLREILFGLIEFFPELFIGLEHVGHIACSRVRCTLAFLPEGTGFCT